MRSHKRVVVTGASGLLGIEVCRQLDLRHVDFLAITMSNQVSFRYGNNIRIDLRNADTVERLLQLKPTHIVHCAAVIPGTNELSDEQIFNDNLQIDRNIFDVCKASKARLNYISSTSVYGFPLTKEVEETDAIGENLSLYTQEKLISEKEIVDSQIDSLILRVNAPYSPNQSTKTVLRLFIESAMKGEDLFYYGSGVRQQDFTHSSDIAELIVNSIDMESQGIFNIAANEPISMKSLAKLVVDQFQECKSQVREAGKPDVQERHLALYNTRQARKVLGWNPTTDLKSGIRTWIKELTNETGYTL